MNNSAYKSLRIREIVQTISLTHNFDKDKLIAINTSDVYNGVMGKGTLTPVEELKGQFKKTIQKDDILFSEIRPANRRFAIVTKSDCSDFVVSTKLMVLRKFNEKVDSSYFYYCLTNQPFLDILQRRAENRIGSFPQITYDLLANYAFPIPPLKEQERISKIIANIDRKIELNRQINDNLEAMAKQLYDYWFVQFDFPNEEGKPYKSSGGAMVWNDKLKREIPSCFEVVNLGNLCDFRNGINYSKDETGNNYQIVNVRNISSSRILLDGEDFDVITVPTSKAENYVLKPDDIIIARSGCPGSTRLLLSPANTLFCGFIICCSPNDSRMRNYLVYCLKQLEGTNATTSGGSILQNVSQDTLKGLHIIVPEKQIIDNFNKTIELIFARMLNCLKESKALTKQRDELLPLLMNGQASVNYHLSALFLSSLILYRDQYKFYDMKETIIQTVLDGMRTVLTENQLEMLTDVTRKALSECEITPKATEEEQRNKENAELLGAFISSKKVEGCSDKTINYYKSSIEKLIVTVKKNVCDISTNDIRCYLAEQQEQRGLSKVTIDNLRRVYSSFFSWLEDEDYITKSPVRRIHKVRTDALVKEVLTDENIEVLRDSCHELRDIAMIDLLLSTGMRVGELVRINREDIDLHERQCVVFGKGNKEREVYFNARAKIHLKKYLEQRTDDNPALFVSLKSPYNRLTINGVEVRLRKLGAQANIATKVHPHKFRRTLATMAIDKGMPIEQVQKMLGHVKIDTTMHYAMVNQANVKIAHRKFIN